MWADRGNISKPKGTLCKKHNSKCFQTHHILRNEDIEVQAIFTDSWRRRCPGARLPATGPAKTECAVSRRSSHWDIPCLPTQSMARTCHQLEQREPRLGLGPCNMAEQCSSAHRQLGSAPSFTSPKLQPFLTQISTASLAPWAWPDAVRCPHQCTVMACAPQGVEHIYTPPFHTTAGVRKNLPLGFKFFCIKKMYQLNLFQLFRQ